jgi:hypothetical protein
VHRPRRLGIAQALAVLAALLLLALLPVAGASARPAAVGLVTGAYLVPRPGEVLDDAVAAGARWSRDNVSWYRVQPFPGVWDWSASDRLMVAAAHRGVRILPLLTGAPCWAVAKGTRPDACAATLPSADADFARFAAHAARRYGPGGTFWRQHRTLDGRLAPTWFEVLNEPEFAPPHAKRGATPERYARLLRATVTAGRAAAPRVRWLAAATGEVRDHTSSNPDRWISWAQGMDRGVPGIAAWIDGLAIHPYPAARPATYLPQSGTDPSFHRTERIAGDFAAIGAARPVWITEVGYSACRAEDGPYGWCVPGRTQAARERLKGQWLAQLLRTLDDPMYGDVQAVFVYALHQGGGTPLERRFGLLDPRGRRLPAWTAFRAAARRPSQ